MHLAKASGIMLIGGKGYDPRRSLGGPLGNNAIGVTTPDGGYQILVRDDERMLWPDGLSYGPDGYFYVTVNQLHRSAVLNAGEETSEPPFLVMRFRPLAASAIGR
jgi:hypothetical protein